jgi:hypothetical protein
MIAKLNANPLAHFEIQAIKRRQHIGSTFTPFEKWLFRLAMILAIGFLVIGIGAYCKRRRKS